MNEGVKNSIEIKKKFAVTCFQNNVYAFCVIPVFSIEIDSLLLLVSRTTSTYFTFCVILKSCCLLWILVVIKATTFLFIELHFTFMNFKVRRSEKISFGFKMFICPLGNLHK